MSNAEKRDKDKPGQNERSSSTPALKIVALVSTPGYLQCKKINWVLNDNPQKKCIVMKFSYMSTTPCINQSLYIVERIISIPGTQSNAPILTRAPPGTKLQSNSNYKSQDSSDYTWSSALKRRAMKNCKKKWTWYSFWQIKNLQRSMVHFRAPPAISGTECPHLRQSGLSTRPCLWHLPPWIQRHVAKWVVSGWSSWSFLPQQPWQNILPNLWLTTQLKLINIFCQHHWTFKCSLSW